MPMPLPWAKVGTAAIVPKYGTPGKLRAFLDLDFGGTASRPFQMRYLVQKYVRRG